jgi:hypothetical protein
MFDAERLVEIGATEEVTAGFADEFAAAVLEAGGAGGAEDGVMLVGGEGTLGSRRGGWAWGGFGDGLGDVGLHFDSVAQFAIFSTAVAGWDASNDVRFDK